MVKSVDKNRTSTFAFSKAGVFCIFGLQKSGATFIVLYKCIVYIHLFVKNSKHIMQTTIF